MQFLGNNYTGNYRNVTSITDTLRSHDIDVALIGHYTCVMTVCCPNHFNASTRCANTLLYWRHGNHPSIRVKINQVMLTMNKEEQNNYIIHVPHWLWGFLPHCFITPHHILKKPGKKDRRTFDASWKYHWNSTTINSMRSTPYGFECQCEFGTV